MISQISKSIEVRTYILAKANRTTTSDAVFSLSIEKILPALLPFRPSKVSSTTHSGNGTHINFGPIGERT